MAAENDSAEVLVGSNSPVAFRNLVIADQTAATWVRRLFAVIVDLSLAAILRTESLLASQVQQISAAVDPEHGQVLH